ncbi:MAG: NAD-dependent epimerase/dehydratase family protein, partial [Eudoraea sp.]|nr:NAD-dependent epimerase/dehydratase family protein [Eudoraea sp.]
PWGRPDMALFLFTKAIIEGESIEVYNHGKMERDFTYIEDICTGVVKIIEGSIKKRKESEGLYKVYNIGNSKSVKLLDFIEAIEKTLGLTATKILLPIQPGDVSKTWADVGELINDYNYKPNTPVIKGIQKFIDWYKAYYNV